MKLGLEDVSLLEKCLHFLESYVQASVKLRSEDTCTCMSPIKRSPHFREF